MEKLEVDKVAINLRLMKLCCFYQMFDPNSAKFFNRNVYQLICIVYTAFTLCVIVFGLVGMFTNKDEGLSDIDLILLMVSYIHYYLSVVKISVFLYKANTVWDLFDIARLDFLKSKPCRKNINTLYNCRKWIIKVTNYFTFALIVLTIQWLAVPLVGNAINNTVNRRNQNIINLRVPVSIHTYNQYYVIFYVFELTVLLLSAYTIILCDMVIMSFCWVIINQYQVLTKSFADVGYANKPQSEHYEDFKSVLYDQIQLHLKLNSFYDIIRPIMLIYVGLSSCVIITITYVLISICSSLESYSALQVLTIVSSTAFAYLEFFLYCYLLDHIDNNCDSVNLGMYSSNWTIMDLKFKKLLLLVMRMNDTNKISLKASPSKIINLQLFANVMKICYNITSVMLKTMKNKQK